MEEPRNDAILARIAVAKLLVVVVLATAAGIATLITLLLKTAAEKGKDDGRNGHSS